MSLEIVSQPDIAQLKDVEIGVEASVQGRIVSIRESRNFIFVDLADWSGKIQLCFDKTTCTIPDTLLSLGNVIAVTGKVGVSRSQEKTIFVADTILRARCELPIGKKQIALPDLADRLRNRIVDGIQNPETLAFLAAIARTKLALRTQLAAAGFLECDTGILHDRFDAGLAQPFTTFGNAVDRELYLRLTAELRLKMLLIAGCTKVFELGPSFRNEGMNAHYNPEFTLLEAYTTATDLAGLRKHMMTWTENAVRSVYGTATTVNDEHTINFAGPWLEVPFFQVLSDITNTQLDQHTPHAKLVAALAAQEAGEYSTEMPLATLLLKATNKIIAPRIAHPTYLTDMPASACSPFVASAKDDPLIAQSSWLVIDGMVVGDLYQDDNDPMSLREKLTRQATMTGSSVNEDFLEQLRYGLAPSVGMGIGLNRLFLAMRPRKIRRDIKETLPFPLLK